MQSFRKLIFGVLGVLVVVWLGTSTWFRVQEHEEALVMTMGKATRTVEKGVHFKLPAPFETVVVLPVRVTNQLTFGYREQGVRTSLIQDEALMITGDENLVWADLLVEWKIGDIKKYLFHTQDPERLLRNAVASSLRSVIGTTTLDSAITTGKFEVQSRVEGQLIELMNGYDAGIQVISVKLQDVEPPDAVKDEFKAVTDAREARVTKANEAGQYRNDRLPRARGEAQQLIEVAEGKKVARINQAMGDVARYQAIFEAYRAAPGITERRLILETLEAILPGADITIVDTNAGTVQYLPISPRR